LCRIHCKLLCFGVFGCGVLLLFFVRALMYEPILCVVLRVSSFHTQRKPINISVLLCPPRTRRLVVGGGPAHLHILAAS
jgi:hypothetical protein